jgi:hypothetical protein
MLRIQDTGSLVYGGLVTGTQWWDEKRISEGKLAAADTWKKFSTWTYLGIGLIATLMSAFGWMRRYESWAENVSHGFFFYLPIFAREVIGTMEGTSTGGTRAVAEATRILSARRSNNALAAGGMNTHRSYQPEFNQAQVF